MDPPQQQQITIKANSYDCEGYLDDNEGSWSLQGCLYFNDGYYCYQVDSNGCTSGSQKFGLSSKTYKILRKTKQLRERIKAKEQQLNLLMEKFKNKPFVIQTHQEHISQNQNGFSQLSLDNITKDNQELNYQLKKKDQPNFNTNQLHLHLLYSMKLEGKKDSHCNHDQIPSSGQFFYISASSTPNEFSNDYNDQIPESTLSFLQSQRQNQDRLNEQIAYLRQQNIYLKEQLSQIQNSHEQLLKQNEKADTLLTKDQINGLIQQLNSYTNQVSKLQAEKHALQREIGLLGENLKQIGKSNDELHKRLSLNAKEMQRQRKQNKKSMKEFEQRVSNYLQGEKQKFLNLQQELNQAREEIQNKNEFVCQCQQQINRLNKTLKDIEEQYESLMSEKDQILNLLQSSNKKHQQQTEVQQLLQLKQAQNQQLKEQIFTMEREVQKFRAQAEQYEYKYENELQLRNQELQIIQNLDKQLQILKKNIEDKQASLVFQSNITNYNKNKGMRNRSLEGISTCSASSINRVKVLCNEPTRKTVMGELRKLLRQIGNIQLENKICALVQELYMDAEYRERSSIKLQQIIGQLEDRIQHLQAKREMPVQQNPSRAYLTQLEQSLNRYERLLRDAQGEKMKLMQEVTSLRKENHQIRLELADSDLDNQTQRLIEQLTLQLEREKYNARELEQQNEVYHNEIISLQKELYEKNKRLKLLGLNLNRKQGGQDIEVNVL